MAKTLTLEISDEQFAAIEEAAQLVDLAPEELARLAIWAVARSARARGALRLPIRLESAEEIRFRPFDPPGQERAGI